MKRKKIKGETFPWEQCMRELGKLRRRELPLYLQY